MLRRSPSGEADFVFDWVFADPPVGNGAGGKEDLCTTPAGDTVSFRVNDEARRFRSRRAWVRRTALGSVDHGRGGGAEDDRDGRARVYRSGRDLHDRSTAAPRHAHVRYRLFLGAVSAVVRRLLVRG